MAKVMRITEGRDFKAERLAKEAKTNGRAEPIHVRLMEFAKKGALDLLQFTHAEHISMKRLKKMAAESQELQEALDYARETIAMNLRSTWREKPQFKDYAHANVEYNDDDYKAYRNEVRAQIAKNTGAVSVMHITSDTLGIVAPKE